MQTLETVRERYYNSQETMEGFRIGLDGLTLEQFLPEVHSWATPLTEEGALFLMREYLASAWQAAHHGRGIQALQFMFRLDTVLWILGDEETRVFVRMPESCENFCLPAFRKIAETYGCEIPKEVQ